MQYLFEDILVIDAATFLAGPGAATVLGDFGASVVKIEPPEGDRYRTLKGQWQIDYNWLLTSRNKKSLSIDIGTTEGKEIVHSLVQIADVFITNFIGDQLTKYQYEYERLNNLNPKLVYAHITGYGSKGPHVAKRGFDSSAWWARSGLMDYVREQGVHPSTSAPGMGDHATAITLFSGIVAALYRREKTGKGGYVSTSLLANGIWSNGMMLQGVLEGTDLSARRQTKGFNNPFHHCYTTADGHFILFTVINAEREWPSLAHALQHPEWIHDERFVDLYTLIQHRHELIELIQDCLSKLTIDQALECLEQHEVTHSWVQPNHRVVDDVQAAANDMIVETSDTGEDYQRTIMNPLHIDNAPKKPPRRAPDIGANSREVLSSYLGLSGGRIDQLVSKGVVKETTKTK